MLSLIQAEEIRNAIVEYLKATYNFEEKNIEQAFEDFLYNKRYGMFKGPYIQIKLPFERLDASVNVADVLKIAPSFPPYLHQYEAFKRLSNRNSHPQPVILTTGTGSGKTESFLYPILDYCYENTGRPGIKAIILYPMNALATDQARRLAAIIYNFKDSDGNYVLRDRVRAGLFIGEGKQKGKQRATRMEEHRVIEDRETLVQSPPDILLTNFKMLDFSLMQARFHNMWKHNYNDTSLLKFIVLDELHTYDGARGSDVANLIRRLKLKLSLENNQLIPVGTSATMAGGSDGKKELVTFFSQIFGMEVGSEALIEEKRVDPAFFFDESLEIPTVSIHEEGLFDFTEVDEYDVYINRQLQFWGYSPRYDELLVQLKKNKWLYELVTLASKGVVELEQTTKYWMGRCFPDGAVSYSKAFKLLQSLTAVLSYAKELSGSRYFPFVYFQTSYWIRSLHRIIRKLQPAPSFAWETDINPNEKQKSLPPYYCRECGGSGWIAIKKEHNDNLEDDLTRTRLLFMADRQNKNIYFISSIEHTAPASILADDYSFTGEAIDAYVDPVSLRLFDKKVNNRCFRIFGVRRQNDDSIEKICPHCNSRNTLALIGTGLPTLESIVAAQLMATATDPAEDHDRKLLAFTNGVQDAAHQAGFIENRNFRFGMRHAIQRVLKQNTGGISLPDLYKAFERFWRDALQHENRPEEAFIYKFLPPDCDGRLRLTDLVQKDGKFTSEFLTEFSHRLSWEIWSEFSFSAGIGRTLEKAGASAVEFDLQQFQDVYNQLKFWLEKETLGDRINEASFSRFLLGFLHRLRFKGGVDHPYLKKYRSERTNFWLITQNTNKKHFLIKNFGKQHRLPKFATLLHGAHTGAFETIQTQMGKHNWYSTWFLKCFPLTNKSETALINEFYQKLFEYLEANKLLDKKVAAGVNNVGINPDQIFLSINVSSFECKVCGNLLNVGKQNASLVKDMPCLHHRCHGTYEEKDNTFDYYRMVYNRGRALRIFAKDHTGLIDRNKREWIEQDFKYRPTYQSTNVLVATSTLEMGIDIGDLNIAFNASIPPETANYLQRVGRAGRSSGTSLIVNLAGRDQHDQYFFEDTMQMMQGDIRTPSCYLGARDILRRHFMAFCFDLWATASPENNNIPLIVRMLRLRSYPTGDTRFVFNQLAEFISKNKTKIFDAFKNKYTDAGVEEAIQQIEMDLLTDEPVQRLRAIHELLLNEINYYKQKMAHIDAQLVNLPDTGPETALLKSEKRALSGAIYNINKRNTIEYLTNLGILPNYAFPETGVHINAQIVSRVENDNGTRYQIDDFGEIVRPASSAITELAPGNVFYSQGYKLVSQGLEIMSKDDYEFWRFCSNCDHLKLDVDVPKNEHACPKCNHNSWGSLANRKMLLKLQGVLSVNNKEESKINDSSEDRDRKFYNKSVHLRTDPRTSRGAKVLKRIPFGIEFFTHADYLEINTGIREEGFWGNRRLMINEREHPEVGFVVCKTCGKSTERPLTQYEIDNKIRSYHFAYCSHRSSIYQGMRDDNFEELYLYRRFQTEALKILLPVLDFRTEEKVSIFKAGLLLGLKNYYKGHPDHVNIREFEEFNADSGTKERYLVMYESIPGGTGYLSRLYNTDEFNRLLQVAYDHIVHCSCKDEGKDGCYKCIYTYANQYNREGLSRLEAEQLFKEIIDRSNEWSEAPSLTNLTHTANNEESELEDRFIALLREEYKGKAFSDFEELTENGYRKYRLTLREENNAITYEIWPQNLGHSLPEVRYTTRPDFVFKCVSWRVDGQYKPFEEVQQVKDIIVYLDGYQFHASGANLRVERDVKIRDAIGQSGRYHLWVFTWEDITNKNGDAFYKKLNVDELNKISSRHPLLRSFDVTSIKKVNSFMRFDYLLGTPLRRNELQLWSAVQLFSCQTKLLAKCIPDEQHMTLLTSGDETKVSFEQMKPQQFAVCDTLQFEHELRAICLANPATLEIKAAIFNTTPAGDYQKDNWVLFWQVYNLLQFHNYYGIESEPGPESTMQDEITGVLENFRPELHDIVKSLMEQNININREYDFDLIEGGIIIAQAELGSDAKKFFMFPFDAESRARFLAAGYREYTIETFDILNLQL